MVNAVQPQKAFDEQEQVIYYHSRVRTRGFRDLKKALFRTHFFSIPATTIGVGSFTKFASPVTFVTAIRLTGAASSAQGLVFEIGDEASASAMWLESNNIGFQVGQGEAAPFNNSTHLLHDITGTGTGAEFELVVGLIPGSQRVFFWINGAIKQRSSGGVTYPNDEWSSDTAGSFASAPSGEVCLGVPVGSRIAPSGFTVIEPLSVYQGQKPRHFV